MRSTSSSALVLAAAAVGSAIIAGSLLFHHRRKKVKEARPVVRDEKMQRTKPTERIEPSPSTSAASSGEEDEIDDMYKTLTSLKGDQPIRRDANTALKPHKRQKAKTPTPDIDREYLQHVPGHQKIFVRTFGCSHNSSDSETMMGVLQEYGYTFVSTLEESDGVLINSCTVKGPSQDAMTELIKKAKANSKPVLVAGCVPQADRKLPAFSGVSLLGVMQLDRAAEAMEATLRGEIVKYLAKKELPSLSLPRVRRSDLIEIIPLSTGCLGSCTYCKTKHARGSLGSYAPHAILERVRVAVSEGVQQIWLTSEDTGAYGLDMGTHIVALLEEVIDELESNSLSSNQRVMLRLGMTNPPYMLAHRDAISSLLRRPNVFEFLHVPVQSGSNAVLEAMKREYTIEDFNTLVEAVRGSVKDCTIATDIICGFPTENEQDHQESLGLIEKHRFPVVNISQFYPRPGTPAAKMKRLPNTVAKRRSGEVTTMFNKYETTSHLVGSTQRVWISAESDRSPDWVGHTKTYTKVLVPKMSADARVLMGSIIEVRITEATKWHVVGIPLASSPT